MSFKSFLSAAGHDFLAVFKYLGSPQGQKTVTALEGAAVVAGTIEGGPALGSAVAGIETLFNAGLKSALNIEASAAAVGAQSGTGAQKSAAVIATLDTQSAGFLESIGVKDATAEEVQTLSKAFGDAAANILNSIPARAVQTAPAAA